MTLDDPSDIGSRIERDGTERTDGEASIRVTARWPTVINVGSAPGPKTRGGRLIYRADVRSSDLDGTAYLELWVHLPKGGMYFSRSLNDTITGSVDWKEIRAEFRLESDTIVKRVTLNLVINGRGTVWIDNVRLDHFSR